jgi:hypothetical protein
MQMKSKNPEKVVYPKKAEVLDYIWKGLDDSYYVVAAQSANTQAVAPQPADEQPAGWLRNRPIPGL